MKQSLKIDKNLDKHLKILKSEDGELSSLEVATEGNGARISGDLDVTGYTDNIKIRSNSIIKADGNVTLDSGGDITLDSAGDLTINVAGGQMTVTDNTALDPDLIIKSNDGSSSAGNLVFLKDRDGSGTTAGQDGDSLGFIRFKGYNDYPEQHIFAQLKSNMTDVTNSTEAGSLSIAVRTKDSGFTGSDLETGLLIEGSDTNDQLNVTIANGAASLTTIAGNVDIDGDTITTAGNITLDSAGDITLDAGTGVFKFLDAGDPDDYASLTVVGGTGATTLETVSAAADGHLSLVSDGDIVLNAGTGKYIMKGPGTVPEFSVANSAYAGMILGYRCLGHDSGRVGYTITTGFVTLHADATVRFIAPPSGVVEVHVQAGSLSAAAGRYIYLGLSDNATYNTLGAVHEEVVWRNTDADSQVIRNTWVISGLTAGDTYNYWFGIKSNSVGSTLNYGGTGSGHYSPFIMKVTALPTATADFAVYG